MPLSVCTNSATAFSLQYIEENIQATAKRGDTLLLGTVSVLVVACSMLDKVAFSVDAGYKCG